MIRTCRDPGTTPQRSGGRVALEALNGECRVSGLVTAFAPSADDPSMEPAIGAPLMGWMAPAPGVAMRHYGGVVQPQAKEPSMGEITTIGLDLATRVFQVHAVGRDGKVVVRRQLRRSQMLEVFS